MVTRKLLTVSAVGLSVGLLAQHATGAEIPVVQKAPVADVLVIDMQVLRNDIESHVRELNRLMREALSEELRRELKPAVVMANNELRTRS